MSQISSLDGSSCEENSLFSSENSDDDNNDDYEIDLISIGGNTKKMMSSKMSTNQTNTSKRNSLKQQGSVFFNPRKI